MVNQSMDNTQIQLQKLQNQLNELQDNYYKNNFPSHQVFNKSVSFTTKLKVPHYDTAPITAEVGEIIEVGGKLYICSTTNTFSLVGTQT